MQPFLYVYGVGGLVFAAGMYVAFRHGYFGLRGRGLMHLLGCLLILGFFAAIQAYLQFAPMTEAPPQPYRGTADALLETEHRIRGTPLDYGIMVAYFLGILAVGTWFGRRQKTARDFFFAGQRFSWWLVTFSLVATTVGSYSFVKYSSMGYKYGLSSSQSYLNDWIWFPLLAFGWLPILYFSRITSIPEYFGRRFNSTVRFWATMCLLIYLVGYIGVNLFTMGRVLEGLLGWPVFMSALIVACISMTYVTVGGQTSVIMTDLFQGVMLLATGALILVLGANYLGGFDALWENLPRGHRLAFPNFNEESDFPTVGIFWQDAIANTAMFYFLNQGIIMRYLASKSVEEARKATFATVLVLMTVAAAVVAGGGWVAAALVNHGDLPADLRHDRAFYVVTELISTPGVFGLILASLTAALMSTVDTLITAVSAVFVNDIYKPYLQRDAAERDVLRMARWSAIAFSLIGLALVPVYANFRSIYEAHGAFTAAVTPPLVVTLLMSVFWRRFTAAAALSTLIGGGAAIGLSLFFPQLVMPFAQGVPVEEPGRGVLGTMNQHQYMRALYGLTVCTAIGVMVTVFTRPESRDRQAGLVWGTIAEAIRRYKGSPGHEHHSIRALARPIRLEVAPAAAVSTDLPVVAMSAALARVLQAAEGDVVYLSDRRWWLGGLRSTHAVVGRVEPDDEALDVKIDPVAWPLVVARGRDEVPLRIERLY